MTASMLSGEPTRTSEVGRAAPGGFAPLAGRATAESGIRRGCGGRGQVLFHAASVLGRLNRGERYIACWG